MMNVFRMRWIVDILDGGALPDVAREAARRWQGESLVYVRSSANHLFRLILPDGKTGYLRLTPAAERSLAALQAEVEFVEHVARAGVTVARPLPSAAGAFIEAVEDPQHSLHTTSEGHRYHAVVFAGLPGRQLELDELDEPRYRAWGRTLARLHQASQSFPLRPARATLHDEIQRARAGLPADELAAAQVLEAGAAWLATLPTPPAEYGLLHGDCELDNLVWDGERPQVLDFDSALYGPHMVDVAIALQDIWAEESLQRDDHVAWFCAGYREVRPLPARLYEAMPRLLTLLAAIKVAQLLHAYEPAIAQVGNAEVVPPDPPWLARMRDRHRQWLDAQRVALAWR